MCDKPFVSIKEKQLVYLLFVCENGCYFCDCRLLRELIYCVVTGIVVTSSSGVKCDGV